MSQDQQQTEKPVQRMIEVPVEAFYEVLQALNGPGHLIRELQATQSLDKVGLSMGRPNPINVLIDTWNAYVEKETGGQKPAEGEVKNEQG
jgi:hypothetical protein